MLLSINPEHFKNILSGRKHHEFRRVRCRESVDRIIIYSTAPDKQAVADAYIEEVIEDTSDDVWQMTCEFAGISHESFKAYYAGKDKAVAYKLHNVREFPEPRSLSDCGLRCAPQSFAYVESIT
jgi:predicted transcriptional regulator